MKISFCLSRLVSKILGKWSWDPPPWLQSTRARIDRLNVRYVIWGMGGLLALLFLWLGGLLWPQGAKLRTVSVQVIPPPLTVLQTNLVFNPVRIQFGDSVARLEQVDKKITRGITLRPSAEGEWRWEGDRCLRFDPDHDWPAGRPFTVTCEPSLFADHVRLPTRCFQFQTAPFNVSLDQFVFYVDPRNPAVHQAVATLQFTHPVDPSTLSRFITFKIEGNERILPPRDGNTKPFVVLPGLHRRLMYLRTDNLNLPHKEAWMKLLVGVGIPTAAGEARSSAAIEKALLIPDVASFLRVQSAEGRIIRNANGEPSQLLIVTTSIPVKTTDLARRLRAFELPKDKAEAKAGGGEKPILSLDAAGFRNASDCEWSSPREVTDAILALAKPVALEMIPGELECATTHTFRFAADDRRFLYVRLNHGLEAPGGFILGDDYDTVFHVPVFPREVNILHSGAVLALSGERKLSVRSLGVPALEFQLGQVIPSQINHLVSQSYGNFQNPYFETCQFNEENLTASITERQILNATGPAQAIYSAFDFSRYVTDPAATVKHGLFFVRVHGWDPVKKEPLGNEDRRFILLTDLGLLVKDNQDGSHDVFVQSIRNGGPVAGARVEVLGKNGIPLANGETGVDGKVALPSLRDFVRERQPVAYVVHHADDLSFIPYDRPDRRLNLSRFDIGGVEVEKPDDLDAFLFTDRGLYRPGDTAHIGLIVKRHNWKGGLEGIPLEVEVTDPRGMCYRLHRLALPKTGFTEWELSTQATTSTGRYEVRTYLVVHGQRSELLGNISFRVEEFLPDRMKIQVRLSVEREDGWVKPDELKGLVHLENLFGAPAADHRITASLRLDPAHFGFARYPAHVFYDPLYDKDHPPIAHQEDLSEQKTDAQGNAEFGFDLQRFQRATYRLTFAAQGFELEGGRSVADNRSVLVSALDYLIGFKGDGELGYIHKDSQRSVELLAVNSQLDPVAAGDLQLKIIERRQVSVLTRRPDGNYAYESVLKENEIHSETIRVTEKGLRYVLPTHAPGDFVVRAFDSAGLCRSEFAFAVAGEGNLTRSLDKNAELKIRIPKNEFQAGDEIPVHIVAPYTGAGLITIERDRVYAHRWFKTTTTSSVQTIFIPKDFEGNGYLQVAFVRALDSREIFMSPLSYAVLPFSVNRNQRRVTIEIQTPAKARPGEPFPIRYQADRPCQIVVYAVDEGILQVARYTTPDPLGHFFRKTALQVQTMQIMDLILPEFSIVRQLAAAGGDGGEEMLARHLNPFKRKTDAPVAFWSGILDAGPRTQTVTYQVPDYFSGTLRVMAVAVAPEAVGSAEKKSLIKGPFVINPNVPTFVAPGDAVDVSVSVANQVEGSGADLPVTLTIQATDGLEVVQRPQEPLRITENREAPAHFLVKVRDCLGNVDLTFTVQNGEQRSKLTAHLSVRPPVPYRTTVRSGYFDGGQVKVPVQRNLYPPYRQARALLSASPMGFSHGLREYLQNYAYGCTEQLVSKALPTLVLADELDFGMTRAQVEDHVGEIVNILCTRQNSDGAFGYWSAAERFTMDFPSVHAMHFLTEARRCGYGIPEALLNRGLEHLRKIAIPEPQSFDDARVQAYAIYLLTRNGEVTSNHLVHLRGILERQYEKRWPNDVAGIYLAASYALLKQEDEGEKIIRAYRLGSPESGAVGGDENSGYYTRLAEDAQYLMVLSRHFPQRLHKLGPDDLRRFVQPVSDSDFNTLSAAYCILALQAYTQAVDLGSASNVGIAELTADRRTKSLALSAGHLPAADFSGKARELQFRGANASGKGLRGLFYQITETGFDQTPPGKASHEGIEVQREYRDLHNDVVDRVPLGDELKVCLKLRGLKHRRLANVAIVDLLPGGFEVVPESISTGFCDRNRLDSIDVREDRVVFFGSADAGMQEIVYRIKATNRGEYTTPPPFAESMYNQRIHSQGVAGKMRVGE